MSQITSLDKFNNNKKLEESSLLINLKRFIHPLLLTVSGIKIKYKICKCSDGYKEMLGDLKNRPIIFACNHGTCYDAPIAFKAIKKHAILFAAKQPLEKMDEIFFNLNGTIYVDRKNKEDMSLSKINIENNLKLGRDVLVFPEGTWNMEDSKIMLEMKWGIIDIAKESNAIIIPLALDYDYDERICRYKFGKAIDPSNLSNLEGIQIVRDSLATLKWDLFEKKEKLVRKDLDLEEERKKIMHSIEEYPKLNYEYEKSVVFKKVDSPEEVFGPIKRLNK